jgi:hypothetical protein
VDAEHYIALGKMEATVKALKDDVTDIKTDQKTQNAKLDKLIELHHERKGAIRFGKILVAFVTSSGFAGWIWEHLHK